MPKKKSSTVKSRTAARVARVAKRKSEQRQAESAFNKMNKKDKLGVMLGTKVRAKTVDEIKKSPGFRSAVKRQAGKPGDFTTGAGKPVLNMRNRRNKTGRVSGKPLRPRGKKR